MKKVGTKNPTPKRSETKTQQFNKKRKELMQEGKERRKNNKKGKY